MAMLRTFSFKISTSTFVGREGGSEGAREGGERERDRQTDRETDRETDRQTDRERDMEWRRQGNLKFFILFQGDPVKLQIFHSNCEHKNTFRRREGCEIFGTLGLQTPSFEVLIASMSMRKNIMELSSYVSETLTS